MSDLATELAKYDIDYPEAMDRMGDNADLYKRLAMKYLDDSNYVNLAAAMDAKDYDKAYEAAHALKGVSGNLSFKKLYEISSTISSALYEGEYQAANSFMDPVKDAHERVIDGLVKWSDGAIS